jgi:DNA repair exonuclease SbcCD ATPase subunit
MARIALGITLLLLLATCYFGYASHSKIGDLSDKVAGLQQQADSDNQQVASAAARERSAEDQLKQAKSDAQAAQDALAPVQANLEAASGTISQLTSQIADLTTKLSNVPPPAATPPPGPSMDDFNKVTSQLKDATEQIAELNQVKDTLTTKATDAEGRADDLQKEVDHYKNATIRNGLEGEVLAVSAEWNFVVLSIGDRQGAVANAEMILTRGDSKIGKVRISSVEPSTSVADIIPGSLARGVQVQPGDHVIFPGS